MKQRIVAKITCFARCTKRTKQDFLSAMDELVRGRNMFSERASHPIRPARVEGMLCLFSTAMVRFVGPAVEEVLLGLGDNG